MPRFAANLTMLFNEAPFLDRFALAARAGFEGVEYLFPYEFDKTALRGELDRHGLTQVLHNLPAGDWAGGERGIAILPDRIDEFRKGVATAIDYATALGCRQVNCLVGIAPDGVPDSVLRTTLVANLKLAAAELGKCGIRLLIEPINRFDIPAFISTRSGRRRRSSRRSGAITSSSSTTSTTSSAPRANSSAPTGATAKRSRTYSLPTIPDATSRGPARSTTPSSSTHWKPAATTAGSGANTSR